MSRQNRNLIIFFVAVVLIVGWLLVREGLFKNDRILKKSIAADKNQLDEAPADLSAGPSDPAPVVTGESAEILSKREKTLEIIALLKACLGTESNPPENLGSSTEAFLDYLQNEFGSAESVDRWRSWHFNTKDGKERRLRLEVINDEDGTPVRELHYFAIDNDGLPVPIPLNEIPSRNPPNEVLEHFLAEGEVFMREHAAGLSFNNGNRMEYQEREGLIEEFEVQKGDTVFRCSGRQIPAEQCQCVE